MQDEFFGSFAAQTPDRGDRCARQILVAKPSGVG
jgi:hypothetical protein